MRTDVEFAGHHGTTLRGWRYTPEGANGAERPGIVMAHGFSATKEMGLDAYAEVFCAGGFEVLVYDHANLGSSDGEPRQEINPWAQARDYRRALDWFGAQRGVDPARLGIWGSSYSGGEVLVVAAVDARVRAVVANVAFAGLPGVDYGDTEACEAAWAAMSAALDDETGGGPADTGDPVGPITVVREPGMADDAAVFLDQPESSEWFLAMAAERAPAWRNSVTLRNGFGSEPVWDPGLAVSRLGGTPVLFVVATDDRLAATDVTVAAHRRATEPKRLVMIEGHHFTPYAGAALDEASGAACDWFTEWL